MIEKVRTLRKNSMDSAVAAMASKRRARFDRVAVGIFGWHLGASPEAISKNLWVSVIKMII